MVSPQTPPSVQEGRASATARSVRVAFDSSVALFPAVQARLFLEEKDGARGIPSPALLLRCALAVERRFDFHPTHA
jgi:hypothetical protein